MKMKMRTVVLVAALATGCGDVTAAMTENDGGAGAPGDTATAGAGGTSAGGAPGGASGSGGSGGTAAGAGGSSGGSSPELCPAPGCAPGQTCMNGYCYGYGLCEGRSDVACRIMNGTVPVPYCAQNEPCTVAADGTGRTQAGVACSCAFVHAGFIVYCNPGTVCRTTAP